LLSFPQNERGPGRLRVPTPNVEVHRFLFYSLFPFVGIIGVKTYSCHRHPICALVVWSWGWVGREYTLGKKPPTILRSISVPGFPHGLSRFFWAILSFMVVRRRFPLVFGWIHSFRGANFLNVEIQKSSYAPGVSDTKRLAF